MYPVMKLNREVLECRIRRRLNRFVVEVLIDNRISKAHITNTGRLYDVLVEDRIGYCFRINGKKLKYRLFAVRDNDGASLIDTRLQENSFIYFVENNYVSWLSNCSLYKHNVWLDSSIIDYLFKCNDREVYVEVKSAVLRIDHEYAGYPDCPTLRGRRQIEELIKLVNNGGSAMIVFIAGLPGVKGFKPYDRGDPVVAELIREAYRVGVLLKSLNIYYDPLNNSIVLRDPELPVIL